MNVKTKNPKYKVRLTRCWLVELVDKDGYVATYDPHCGGEEILDTYCFGTKEDAIKAGEDLLRLKEKEDATWEDGTEV